jgi:hypothetical protein
MIGSKYSPNGIANRSASAGTAWVDLTPLSGFTSASDNTITAADHFGKIAIRNDHASHTLYVFLRAVGAGTPTVTTAIVIEGKEALSIDCSAADAGGPPLTISVRGSTGTTPYRMVATLYRKFGG